MSIRKSSKKSPAKMLLSIVVIVVAAYFGVDVLNPSNNSHSSRQSITESQNDFVALANAQRSGQMVKFHARIVKTLPDDNDGARHQRFILAIDASNSPIDTVLVAHNIDLALRVPVEKGSIVQIFGQYEWNDQGGVLHWTHHDPGGYHTNGWIELDGQRYD